MLTTFKLSVLVSSLILMTACGSGSSEDKNPESPNDQEINNTPGTETELEPKENSSSDITLFNLSPVTSSDLSGVWIGVADFTETKTYPNYVGTYEGNRTYILQITNSGTGYYRTVNCWGNEKTASINEGQDTVSLLGRTLDLSNLNVMTGTVNFAETGDTGTENWTWIKVSNFTGDIGNVKNTLTINIYGEQEPTNHGLQSFCRETYTYSEPNTEKVTAFLDFGGFSRNENFIFANRSDTGMYSYIGPLSAHSHQVTPSSHTISNENLPEYTATYQASGDRFNDNGFNRGSFDLTAEIEIKIPGL